MKGGGSTMATTLSRLPEGKFSGIVLSNELLDNLAVDLYEYRGRRWHEVCVAGGKEGDLEERLLPVDEESAVIGQLEQFGTSAVEGSRMPIQNEAMDWVKAAIDLLDHGKVVAIDYVRTTRWMLGHPWEDWMRTYRGHRPGASPLELPGTQDITCEVAVDQLASVRTPDHDRTQTDFLHAYGLLDLMADAREAWHSRAALGNLGAVRARARVQEGRTLTDERGLGRYRVLEWDVPDAQHWSPPSGEEKDKRARGGEE